MLFAPTILAAAVWLLQNATTNLPYAYISAAAVSAAVT
jgi:hypothetical protein